MTNIEHHDDAGHTDVPAAAGWAAFERVTATYAVVGLTSFGEHPVQSTRLAEVLGRSAGGPRRWPGSGAGGGTRVGNGLISVDPERAVHCDRAAAHREAAVSPSAENLLDCGSPIAVTTPGTRW